jgi:hypothetical protein
MAMLLDGVKETFTIHILPVQSDSGQATFVAGKQQNGTEDISSLFS